MNLTKGIRTGVLAGVAAFFAFAPAASAITITVDDSGDGVDANLADGGTCSDGSAAPSCTLRAAIQTLNQSGGATNTIDFASFLGGGNDISVATPLPAITRQVTMDACSATATTATKPCVNYSAFLNPKPDGFQITNNAIGVVIRGFAMNGFDRGIFVGSGSDNFKAQNLWFGELNNNAPAAGANTAIQVLSDGAVIGGTAGAPGGGTAPTRNVIASGAAGTGAGIEIAGGDDAVVQGNYIGTLADGFSAAPLATGISVVNGVSNVATDNHIGGPDSGTPNSCDFGCNVIAAQGALSSGIVVGNDSSNVPSGTTIEGNFIGLEAAGAAVVGTGAGTGIRVVDAIDTTIGGDTTPFRNTIVNAKSGIYAQFQAAPGLVVRNNFLGTNPTGTISLAPPDDFGLTFTSDEADPATISSNVITTKTTGTNAISMSGAGASVRGNRIGIGPVNQTYSAGQIAIRGTNNGGLDDISFQDNIIGNASFAAMSIEGGHDVSVTGNRIGFDGAVGDEPVGTGIDISSTPTEQTSNVTIGGDSPATQNLIGNTSGDAISVEDGVLEPTGIHLLQNGGQGVGASADLFLDLMNDGFGNDADGPNGGIQPPTTFDLAATDRMAGLAEPGATVRAFALTPANHADIGPFVGSGTADAHGLFEVVYSGPPGTGVTWSQDDAVKGSSEYGFQDALNAPNPTPPNTTASGPATTEETTPTFDIGETTGGALLLCAVDAGLYAECPGSTFTPAAPLSLGDHTLTVNAIGQGSNIDATPAVVNFTITAPASPGPKPGPGPGPAVTPAPRAVKCKKKKAKKRAAAAKKKKKCKRKKPRGK